MKKLLTMLSTLTITLISAPLKTTSEINQVNSCDQEFGSAQSFQKFTSVVYETVNEKTPERTYETINKRTDEYKIKDAIEALNKI